MTKPQNRVAERLKRELGSDFIEATTPRQRRLFIQIMPTSLRKAVTMLKQEFPELRLMTISTVDHGLDLEFLHHFHANGHGLVITLRSVKPKEDNTLESIVDLIPAAYFIEREIADLFGVKLANHPKPEPLILTKDWPNEKRPLRRAMEGELPPQARPSAETLISTSCVAPISTFIQKKREEAGLPRTPPFAFTDEKTMQEFQGIMKSTGFADKAGYSWEKKRLRYK